MPRLRLLLAAVPALLASACANDLLPRPEPGAYVFEVQYTNYAWAPTWQGVSVDAGGDVWWFDASDARNAQPEGDRISSRALQAKYAHHRRLVAHVDPVDLAAREALVAAAAHGPLQAPRGGCADAGILTYRAFRYDAATDTYAPVLLHQQGDEARANSAPQAAQLTAWLRTFGHGFDGVGCEP
jgi:hypothetical protein